jgi:tetratricopeptide (TPR) repeat protein
MESTFRLRASRLLQPSFMDTGAEDGFIWVLVGTTEADIDKGWQEFVAWREERIAQAGRLYREARGAGAIALLRASYQLLEEAGAQDDPGLLYYEVKRALDAELHRIAELEAVEQHARKLIDSGELSAAEQELENALRLGMDPSLNQQAKMEINDRRNRAAGLIAAGDDLFRDEQYKDAHDRYTQARQFDRDNPGLSTKLAMADSYHRAARSARIRSTVNTVGVSATRVATEYYRYKRAEEERKKAEAERDERDGGRR